MSIAWVYLRWITRATLLSVRWDRLFEDLEAQLESADRDQLEADVADRTRREVARVALADRLRSALGSTVDLTVEGVGALGGQVLRVGPGWVLLEVPGRHDAIVSAAAIFAVRGLSNAADDPAAAGAVASRLDFGHVLRILARDRSPVAVGLRDGSECVGTIDRVGADFVDLAEHAPGEPRRAGAVTSARALAFAGIAVVRPRRG
jgi:hypothetical protein